MPTRWTARVCAGHLVAWIRQESNRIKRLWRLTDSEILSLFSGLAYPCNKVTGAALLVWCYCDGMVGRLSWGLAALEALLRLRLALVWDDFLAKALG